MNIIQMQDDVKGVTTEELIKEVQNPSGAVPVYLLLGELQRREKMKAEHNAQMPEQTVAEQLIEEAIAPNPPQPLQGSPVPPGPGQAMPPQPIPPANQVMPPNIDPTMLASAGVGALPAPNVGQYAEGGVVGFQDGGFFDEGVGEAERRARSVRPETPTAENYSTGLQAEGLAFQEGRKLNPSEGWSNLISSIPREEDLQDRRNFDSSNLISRIPRDNQTADQYAEGGVVGFDNGGMFGRGIEEAERRGILKRMPLSPENVGNLVDNRGSGGFFEFEEGVGEAERTARSVRPEIQAAENYNANFDDFGLSQLLRGKKKGDYLPPGALSPLFKRMGKENPKKAGLMRLLSMPQMKWRLDQDYAQGGVVGFQRGGQSRITDPRDQKQLGEGHWGMFGEHLRENVGPYWWDKLSPELRETIKDVPRVAGEQVETVLESPVGQTVLDIPRVAGEQYETVEEAVEAFPYPAGWESSAYDLTEQGVADPRRTGVTGDLYADESVTTDNRGIPGIDTPSKGIGSLIDKEAAIDTLKNIPQSMKEKYWDSWSIGEGPGAETVRDLPRVAGTELKKRLWDLPKEHWFGEEEEVTGTYETPSTTPKDPDAGHWKDVEEKMKPKKDPTGGAPDYAKPLVDELNSLTGKGSVKDYYKEAIDLIDESGIYADKEEKRAAEMEMRIAGRERKQLWDSVTRAGLAIMSGESQFALTNIGKGLEKGLDAFEKAEDKIEELRDKHLELMSKADTRDRERKITALNFGMKQYQADATNSTNLITAYQKMAFDLSEGTKDRATKVQAAEIAANARLNKPADYLKAEEFMEVWDRKYDAEQRGGFGATKKEKSGEDTKYNNRKKKARDAYRASIMGGRPILDTSELQLLPPGS